MVEVVGRWWRWWGGGGGGCGEVVEVVGKRRYGGHRGEERYSRVQVGGPLGIEPGTSGCRATCFTTGLGRGAPLGI